MNRLRINGINPVNVGAVSDTPPPSARPEALAVPGTGNQDDAISPIILRIRDWSLGQSQSLESGVQVTSRTISRNKRIWEKHKIRLTGVHAVHGGPYACLRIRLEECIADKHSHPFHRGVSPYLGQDPCPVEKGHGLPNDGGKIRGGSGWEAFERPVDGGIRVPVSRKAVQANLFLEVQYHEP